MKALNPWQILRMLALVAVLFVGASAVNTSTADARSLTLINKTGVDIVVLNCVPDHARTWWEDVLGDTIWRNGESVTIDFTRYAAEASLWDFQAHYADGYVDSWYDVDVLRTNTIVMLKNGRNEYY